MLRIEALEKGYSENEAYLFLQKNKKTRKKHFEISNIIQNEIRRETANWLKNNPVKEEINKMNDDELLKSLGINI